MDQAVGVVDVASMAGGAFLVAFLVGAVKQAANLPERAVPLVAIGFGILWAVGLALSVGTFGGNLMVAAMSGIVTAATATGGRSWALYGYGAGTGQQT